MSRLHKLLLLIALYFAQGLPYGFFTIALPAVLRQQNYSLKAISVFSLLALPWALKFLWAPYLDHRGTRKHWLLALQSCSVVAALVLSGMDVRDDIGWLVAGAFVFNFLAASQDVVTDALAVRMLDRRERGLGNGIQVGAYRIGMIVAGTGLMVVLSRYGWSVVFYCMAALLALTMIPVLAVSEPSQQPLRPHMSTAQLATTSFRRLLMPGMLGFAGLIFCYRFGDQMLTTLLVPFLVDQGLDTATIGYMKGAGSTTSLIGAALGGWLAFAAGRRSAVLISGVLQAGSFTLYIAAASGKGGVDLLWIATIVEGVIGTMATVALFTLMMDASDPEHPGTDYTLLASVVIVVGWLGNFVGAGIGDTFGYHAAFTAGTLLALLGTFVVVAVLDRNPFPARVAQVWMRKAHAS